MEKPKATPQLLMKIRTPLVPLLLSSTVNSNCVCRLRSFIQLSPGHEIRGKTIKVELAGKPEPPKGGWQDSRGGRGGRGGGRRGGGGYVSNL